MPEIYNWWRRPPAKEPRTDDRPTNTEQGYLSLRMQVKRMKDAGEQLQAYKQELYDQLEEDFDNVIT